MLFPFFEWLEATPMGTSLALSLWAFAVIESIHLLGLGLLGGSLVLVDLRLLGLGLKNQSIAVLGGHAQKWLVGALILMFTTGTLLLISEPIKLYFNSSFWWKVRILPIALLFTFTIRRKIIRTGALDTTMRTRLVGAVSMLLWFSVAAAGRWIGWS